MKDINDIEKLFSDSFESFEAPVNPELWNGISQGISAAGGTGSAAGIGIITKLVVAASIVGTIGVVSYFGLVDDQKENNSNVIENTTPIVVKNDNTETSNPNSSLVTSDSSIEEKSTEETVETEIEPDKISTENVDRDLLVEMNEPEVLDTPILEKETNHDSGESPKSKTVHKEPTTENQNQATKKEPIEKESNEEENSSTSFEAPTSEEDKALKTENQLKGLFPNTFTPNNDGVNDFLEIKVEEELSFFKIEVFTTKGELVYSSENVNFRWNGNHLNGSPVSSGKYVYQIETKDLNGRVLKPIVKLVEIIR